MSNILVCIIVSDLNKVFILVAFGLYIIIEIEEYKNLK